MIAKNDKDGTLIKYRFKNGKIRGSFYHSTGYKMSDGDFIIDFSWTYGVPTAKNQQVIIAEDITSRYGYKLID